LSAQSNPLLECRGVTVAFGGVTAVNELDLSVRRGEILGIAGPNGAGKTTLFNAISGHAPLASGAINHNGERIDNLPPHAIFQRGIARTFQLPEIMGSQDVYSNVLAGAHFVRDTSIATAARFPPESHQATAGALAAHGLLPHSSRIAAGLSLYEKKLAMLASATAHTPELLLLDEPVGGLTPREADAFRDQVLQAANAGTTLVIIEHVMRFLMALADRIVILHRGEVLFDGTPDAARRDADVRRLYLGARFAT
jgi:ABC-type branched-subunit amino acid transport system ATPase component